MPELQNPPKTLSAPPPRVDVGQRRFTASSADNDREDKDYLSVQASQQAYQDQLAIWQQEMMQRQEMAWMYGYGGYDPYGYDMFGYSQMPEAPQTVEKWGEATQTTKKDLEDAGAIREYGEESILVIANGPEDMRQLNHDAEADMIANAAGGRQTVVMWNPSADALTAMMKEGKFKDVVLSGHGTEGNVYMTGADGTAVAVDGKTFAGYFQDTGVQNVFLNTCHGTGGKDSVAQQLAGAGMNVLGWQTAVKDGEAQNAAAELGALFADGADLEDMQAAAASNDKLSVIAAAPGASTEAAPAVVPEVVPEVLPEAVAPAAEAAPAAVAPENLPIDPYYYDAIQWGGYDPYSGAFMYY